MTAGGETEPKLSFMLIKRNVLSPYIRRNARRTVKNADEYAGKGKWKKRMPFCNGTDKGSKFALTRKGADFHLVFYHKRIYRIFERSKANEQ